MSPQLDRIGPIIFSISSEKGPFNAKIIPKRTAVFGTFSTDKVKFPSYIGSYRFENEGNFNKGIG